MRERRFSESCFRFRDLFAFAFGLEFALVPENDFEHLEAEPEGSSAGEGGVACNPELGAFVVAGNMRLEPQIEEEPHDDG